MTNLITTILGMKLGWLIAIGGGLVLIISLLKNIVTGSFNVAKFAAFNAGMVIRFAIF